MFCNHISVYTGLCGCVNPPCTAAELETFNLDFAGGQLTGALCKAENISISPTMEILPNGLFWPQKEAEEDSHSLASGGNSALQDIAQLLQSS